LFVVFVRNSEVGLADTRSAFVVLVVREIYPDGKQPSQGCKQPRAPACPLSSDEDLCSPGQVQHKENSNDRPNARKPDERLSCYRNHSPLFWYCPTRHSPKYVNNGADHIQDEQNPWPKSARIRCLRHRANRNLGGTARKDLRRLRARLKPCPFQARATA